MLIMCQGFTIHTPKCDCIISCQRVQIVCACFHTWVADKYISSIIGFLAVILWFDW